MATAETASTTTNLLIVLPLVEGRAGISTTLLVCSRLGWLACNSALTRVAFAPLRKVSLVPPRPRAGTIPATQPKGKFIILLVFWLFHPPAIPGTNRPHPHCRAMQWIEAIINISAFVGFIGVASLGEKTCDGQESEEPMV
jgi:hypothetical protein